MWARDLWQFDRWAKLKKSDYVRHNVTIANVLVITSAFIGLYLYLVSTFDRGGGLTGETKLPVQELELKVQVGEGA